MERLGSLFKFCVCTFEHSVVCGGSSHRAVYYITILHIPRVCVVADGRLCSFLISDGGGACLISRLVGILFLRFFALSFYTACAHCNTSTPPHFECHWHIVAFHFAHCHGSMYRLPYLISLCAFSPHPTTPMFPDEYYVWWACLCY